jgi:hypothetical protein
MRTTPYEARENQTITVDVKADTSFTDIVARSSPVPDHPKPGEPDTRDATLKEAHHTVRAVMPGTDSGMPSRVSASSARYARHGAPCVARQHWR